MKHFFVSLLVAATAAACLAQTPAKPAAPRASAKPATTAAGPLKLPAGVPPARGILKTAFSLRYQDVRIGTGAAAEPNKIYKVNYTGWLAADGHKFDSSYDHKTPLVDKDGKPELDADGKPKISEAQPISFPQGFGRVIPGFDQGFTGMKVGGKRRLFIPWQLAYGARGRPGPSAANPGIPPKADLIFDIELVDVSEMQMPARPGMGTAPNGQPMRMLPHAPTGAPTAPATPGSPAAPATPPPTTAPASPTTPPPSAGTPAAPTPPPTSAPTTPPPAGSSTTPPPDKPQSR